MWNHKNDPTNFSLPKSELVELNVLETINNAIVGLAEAGQEGV
jgi:hypothetical protein